MSHTLSADTRRDMLATIPAWQHDGQRDAIQRRYEFEDFAAALAFMTQLALFADKHNHHPEWTNVYNTVDITLTTHDAGGLTRNDIVWAQQADKVFARFAEQA